MSSETALEIFFREAVSRYEQLHQQGKINSDQLALIKAHTGLSDVLVAVNHARAKNEQDRNLVDRIFHKLSPEVVCKLDRFSTVVHTAIQSNPSIAALVWSSVKFLLTILRDINGAYFKACHLVEVVTLSLERYSIYVDILGVTELLWARLVGFYMDVIKFGLDVTHFYARTRMGAVGTSIWKSLQQPFDNVEAKLRQYAFEIDLAAQADQMRMISDGFRRAEQARSEHSITWQLGIYKVPDLLSWKFTGRTRQLKHIYTMLSTSESRSKRVAVYGIPGGGKSQLILQFAKYIHEFNPDCNVFHIDATNRESLVQGFQVIHALLQLPHESRQDIMTEMVKNWLTRCYPGGWLLLVDNVVSIGLVQQFLPAGDSGIILFTMRDEIAAKSLGGGGTLELSCMDTNESVDLILKGADIDPSTASANEFEQAAALGRELGGLPLALDQSATCIYYRRWSLSEYLDLLRREKVKALTVKSIAGSKTVHEVFTLALMNLDPVSVILLKLIVHLDWHNIPTALLKAGTQKIKLVPPAPDVTTSFQKSTMRGCICGGIRAATRRLFHQSSSDGSCLDTTEPPLQSGCGHISCSSPTIRQLFCSSEELEKAISNLHAAALVNRKQDASIWLHDLVYEMIMDLLEESERRQFAKLAVTLCDCYFPASEIIKDPVSWVECEAASCHAITSMRNIKEIGVVLGQTYHLQSKVALYYHSRARYTEAMNLFRAALNGFRAMCGAQHPFTLDTERNIGDVYFHLACKYEMEEWFGEGQDTENGVHGNHHRPRQQTINIATVTRSRERHDAALQNMDNTIHRPRSTDTTILPTSQERFAQALWFYRRALKGSEKVNGRKSPFTVRCLRNTVSVLLRQGKYQQARELLEPVLKGLQSSDDPWAAPTIAIMGNGFYLQNKFEEALEWYKRALGGYKRSCGENHPQTFVGIYNVATALLGQDKYMEALEQFHVAVDGQRQTLGADHPDTIKTERAMILTKELMKASYSNK